MKRVTNEQLMKHLESQDNRLELMEKKLDNLSLVARIVRWAIATSIAIYAAFHSGGGHGAPWNPKQ